MTQAQAARTAEQIEHDIRADFNNLFMKMQLDLLNLSQKVEALEQRVSELEKGRQ